jgi:hypothetical protein
MGKQLSDTSGAMSQHRVHPPPPRAEKKKRKKERENPLKMHALDYTVVSKK